MSPRRRRLRLLHFLLVYSLEQSRSNKRYFYNTLLRPSIRDNTGVGKHERIWFVISFPLPKLNVTSASHGNKN